VASVIAAASSSSEAAAAKSPANRCATAGDCRAIGSTASAPVGRLPAAAEATAYFVAAEALTNVAKHARAGRAEVTARVEDGTLRVRVRDDGVGGAQPEGSGLVGLGDRLAALDGRLRVESPPGGGTLVAADIPCPSLASSDRVAS
jgi:signal transduction histidine kinase